MKTKKVMIVVLIIAVVFSLLLAGCKTDETQNTPSPSSTPGSPSQSPSSVPHPGITVNYIKFEKIDVDALDEEHIKLINDYSLSRGYTYWVDADGTYTVFIGLGERSTAGYGIKVLSVEDNEGNTNILVEETKPGKDEMVAQVITYPYVIVQMKGITNNFNISDTEGRSFEILYGGIFEKHKVICTYEGLIDGTSIETTLDGQPAFFRNDKMASKVDGLDEGILVTIVYSINNEEQKILESIVPVMEDDSKTIKASGIYQGLIDGNSLEVLVGDTYIALRNTEVETMAEGIEKDDIVNITYTVSDEGQFQLLSIKLYSE